MSDSYRNIGSQDQEWARRTKEDGTQVNTADMADEVWDREHGGISIFEHLSKQVALGNTYYFDKKYTLENASPDNVQIIHIKTGSKELHLTSFIVTPEAELFTSELMSSPDITDGSAQIQVFNANHESSNTSEVIVYDDSTLNADGTVFEEVDMFGETGVGQNRRGDRYNSGLDFIFAPNSDYVIRIVNNGGGQADVHIAFRWHEV
jgi:hypothetical protein